MDLQKLYTYNEPKLNTLRKYWGYYLNEKQYIPVCFRPSISPLKESSEVRVHTDFFSDIVALKVGYIYSKIGLTSARPEIQTILDDLERNISMSSLNVSSGVQATSCGVSYRLLYNQNGVLKMKNLFPWNVVMEYEDDIYESTKAYYFHTIEDLVGKKTKCCDIYDKQFVIYMQYVLVANEWIWSPRLVAQDGTNSELHLFNSLPIVPFINNEQMNSNCYSSIDSMNAFDDMHSDILSEIRASRLAYMKIWGELNTNISHTNSDGEVVTTAIQPSEWLKQFGTMLFGVDDQGNKYGDASFLEKKMDDAAIEHNLDRLRQHIYEESKSIDLKQLTDTVNARVFAIKASLMRFDIDASSTETYIRKSLISILTLINQYYSILKVASFDPLIDINISIARNFPVDIDSSATALQKMMAVLPVRKAYSLSDLVQSDEVETLAQEWESSNEVGALNVTGYNPTSLPVITSETGFVSND